MRIGSLFSGVGGLDMAVEQVFPDAAPAWFCEWDDAPSKVLAHHWPDVPNLRDVTVVDWSQVERVDIITGGYPCQPFSASGLRKGTDDERHLWPYVREAIRVLRPRLVVLENVAGHLSLGFGRVLGDMAEDGLHVRWTSVRASDVGAPHHRDRVFIVASPADADRFGLEAGRPCVGSSSEVAGDYDVSGALAGVGGWEQLPADGSVDDEHGVYGPVVARWEALTRPSPPPVEDRTIRPFDGVDWQGLGFEHMAGTGAPDVYVDRAFTSPAFAEWMMGLPHGHVTGVDIPRTAQLKAIGNGVCPPQAAFALRSLLELEAVAP